MTIPETVGSSPESSTESVLYGCLRSNWGELNNRFRSLFYDGDVASKARIIPIAREMVELMGGRKDGEIDKDLVLSLQILAMSVQYAAESIVPNPESDSEPVQSQLCTPAGSMYIVIENLMKISSQPDRIANALAKLQLSKEDIRILFRQTIEEMVTEILLFKYRPGRNYGAEALRAVSSINSAGATDNGGDVGGKAKRTPVRRAAQPSKDDCIFELPHDEFVRASSSNGLHPR